MRNAEDAPLTLADLEAHDPHARGGGVEQRYRCPLPACADAQRKRNLSLKGAAGRAHGGPGARLGRACAVALVCGAASTPSAAILEQLARWRCILSPDNDAHDQGQGLMRRIAAALLERGAAPHWLTLPVGDG